MQNESIFAEGALDRIFMGELVENRRRDGEVDHRVIRGFRHENDEATAAGFTILPGSEIAPDASGVYAAVASAPEVKRRHSLSAFFPRAMKRAEIVAAIIEAHANCEQSSRGSRWFRGTGGGLIVELELDADERIVDAIPRRRKVSRTRRALWNLQRTGKPGKNLCRVCLKPKVAVCPNGHNPPQQPPSQLPKFARWFRRWLGWKFRGSM